MARWREKKGGRVKEPRGREKTRKEENEPGERGGQKEPKWREKARKEKKRRSQKGAEGVPRDLQLAPKLINPP